MSRSYVGSFNFRGGDQQKKVGLLSGGERNRVPPGQDPDHRRQRHPARRTDQRPGHRDPAEPGRRPGTVRRLRRGHQPRPLVPETAWRPTSWPSKATATSNGSRATSKPMKKDKKKAPGRGLVDPAPDQVPEVRAVIEGLSIDDRGPIGSARTGDRSPAKCRRRRRGLARIPARFKAARRFGQ